MRTRSRSVAVALSVLLALAFGGCASATSPSPPGDDADVARDAESEASTVDAGPLEELDAAPEGDAGAPTELDGGTDPEPEGDAGDERPPRCEPSPVARGERGISNDDPTFVQVLVDNIENLKEPGEQCRGDWTDLIHYMQEMRPQPDVFLVQQVSNRAQLDRLTREMNAALRGTYAGIIAEADPRPFNSPCGPEKDQQTNAIVYRTERFAPAGDRHTWQPFARIDGSCRRSGLARTRYVMHRLRDRVAARDVNVVSVHWSTNSGSGADPACAERNAADLDDVAHMAGYEADLLLVGGDANEPDRGDGGAFRPWYRLLNGDRRGELGYRDPIFARCDGATALEPCLDDEWTIGGVRRIDFLFAQRGDDCLPTTSRAHTVTFPEAGAAARRAEGSDAALSYSDHRAVHAEIYY